MKKAIKFLEKELEWKQDTRNMLDGKSEYWKDGFIEGCEYCIHILKLVD